VGVVVVESRRELDGALLVATAIGGAFAAPAGPFVVERGDGTFIACLREGSGDSSSSVRVAVSSAGVEVGWVGALEALVLRDSEVVHRTVSMADTRSPARAGPWPIEPGDLVLLCSTEIHRVLSEGDLTALASRDDIATIVRGLVTTASTRGDFATLSAMAIRIQRSPTVEP
jgi:hypothetical protein